MAILVLDPNADNTIKSALHAEGYEDVIILSTLDDFFSYFDFDLETSCVQVDVVIIDTAFCANNEVNASKLIRVNHMYTYVPIILIADELNNLDEFILDSNFDFIPKPVDFGELALRIKLALLTKNECLEQQAREKQLLDMIDEMEKITEELEKYSFKDSLTSLANRRCFEETYYSEKQRAMRQNTSLALIMLDVDFFKNFNDTYGHPVGDLCLKNIGSVLKNELKRPYDLAARYGGEEFVLLLPFTDLSGAKIVGERMRYLIERLQIPHSNSAASNVVTVSVGVAAAAFRRNPVDLLVLADQALYYAKHEGRNKVACYDLGGTIKDFQQKS